MGDKPWWIKTSTGKFSVKSAWEILRKKVEENANFKKIWVQDLPFKISFFSWRVWTNRVPVATVIANWNPNQSHICLCCTVATMETMEHLFLKAGILGPWIQLKQSIKKWWDVQGNTRQKHTTIEDKAVKYNKVISAQISKEERNELGSTVYLTDVQKYFAQVEQECKFQKSKHNLAKDGRN
ncbi:hypothetical protein KY289_008593 [Solanum tuberosum]|nr:hypothetical protein KY289_008593 [Solanum tuberosum]